MSQLSKANQISPRTALVVLVAASLMISPFLLGAGRIRSVSAASYDPISTGIASQDQFDSIIVAYSQSAGFDPFVIKGQIQVESSFNQYAVSHDYPCGRHGTYPHSYGLLQVTPNCDPGVDVTKLFDPTWNIQYTLGQEAGYLATFADVALALQAWNIGADSVAAGLRNWAYSDSVFQYANQFRTEHAQSGGGTPPPPGGQTTYTVSAGDTLSSIASRFGTSYQAVAQANGISSPYLIYVGEVLIIPGSSSPPPGGSFYYTVQAGDSLYSIGQKFGKSWSSIALANGIVAPYVIYVGQSILIP